MLFIRAVFALFQERGWNAIINDDITEIFFMITHLLTGTLVSVFLFIYCYERKISSINTTILLTLSYSSGHFFSSITTKMISSAVATIYVCFAENESLLQVQRLNHSCLKLKQHIDR